MRKHSCLAAVALCMVLEGSLSFAETKEDDAMRRAVADACKSDTVFLGEPGHHGSSQAIRFKSDVARELILKCGFSTIVFESSFYELLYVDHRIAHGEHVNSKMLLDGIGGLWADTQEFQEFGEFLAVASEKKRLRVFGMDDQLTATSDLSTEELPSELSSTLNGPRAAQCKTILDRHLAWRYEASSPYGQEDQQKLLSCLSEIESASRRGDAWNTSSLPAMARSLQRLLSRDFSSEDDWAEGFNARDESMVENYEYIRSLLRPSSKTIVWGATIHMAKSLDAVSFGKARLHPFGEVLIDKTRVHPFVIATSSLEGKFGRQKVEPLVAAPDDSLEAIAFNQSLRDKIYLDSASLKDSGEVPSRMLKGGFQSGRWSTVVDALMIFRNDENVEIIKR